MWRKKPIAVGLVVITFCLLSDRVLSAQESDRVIELLNPRVSQFFEEVSQNSTSAEPAFHNLLLGGRLAAESETDKVVALAAKASELTNRFGEYRGYDRIQAKRIGEDLVLMKYLYKCEHFPVVWYFTFYRAPGDLGSENADAWRVIIVRFDTELELLGFGEQ